MLPLPNSNAQIRQDMKSVNIHWPKFLESCQETIFSTISYPLEEQLENIAYLKEPCMIDPTLIIQKKRKLSISSEDFGSKLKKVKPIVDTKGQSSLSMSTERLGLHTYTSSMNVPLVDQTASVVQWLDCQSRRNMESFVESPLLNVVHTTQYWANISKYFVLSTGN